MNTLDTAADLSTWSRARTIRTSHSNAPDAWLAAAAALRLAALGVSGVADLSGSARFQTRGRGPAVTGVALTPTPDGGAVANVGVVISVAAIDQGSRPVDVGRSVESAVRATWERLRENRPLQVQVQVVDLSDALTL